MRDLRIEKRLKRCLNTSDDASGFLRVDRSLFSLGEDEWLDLFNRGLLGVVINGKRVLRRVSIRDVIVLAHQDLPRQMCLRGMLRSVALTIFLAGNKIIVLLFDRDGFSVSIVLIIFLVRQEQLSLDLLQLFAASHLATHFAHRC